MGNFICFVLAFSTFIVPNLGFSKPCGAQEACFELFYRTQGNCLSGPSAAKSTIGSKHYDVQTNNDLVPLFLRAYSSNDASFSGPFNPTTVFQEGANRISFNFGSACANGDVFLSLQLHPKGQNSAKTLCQQTIKQGENHIACATLTLDLKEIDLDLYQAIESLKAELAGFPKIIRDEQGEIDTIQKKIEEAQDKLTLLNSELLAILGQDFNSININSLVNALQEDPSLRELFADLTKTVEQIKMEIEQEIETQKASLDIALKGLQKSFRDTNEGMLQYDFDATDFVTVQIPCNEGLDPKEVYSTGHDPYEELSEHILRDLESSLKLGNRADFVAGILKWTKTQSQIQSILKNKNAPLRQMHQFSQVQKKITELTKAQLDGYGFFKDTKIHDRTKRVIVKEIHSISSSLSRDLVDELNQWVTLLSPQQQKVLDEIDEYKSLIEKADRAIPTSDPSKAAKQLALISIESGLEAILEGAQAAFEPGNDQWVDNLNTQSQQSRAAAAVLLDLALGATPGVSIGKDVFEAITGRNLVTGLDLSSLERTLAVVGVISLGTANLPKLAFKVLKTISAQAIKRGVRVVSATAQVSFKGAKQVVDSAASLAHTTPELGRKLDYVLGKATGSVHNIDRSRDMLRQMERIGFPESQGTRDYLADHLKKALNDPTAIMKTQENGRVVRETLLTGPQGSLKVESVWEDSKLITVGVFGKGTGFKHGQ